ncbi:MAG: PIN domain-containing protein [Xenococcaceae cyanobacterium MO_188.B32]|nr:PIN domain-containing protein [Xenococcaceae cyanobacterium MO_188.B32]
MSDVIVDTCIWSLALRGKTPRDREVTEELTSLIKENRAKIIGLIRQEILSGYSDFARYEKLRNKLRAFPNEQVIDVDYESAAEYSNICRSKGIQGSHTDFLICAVSTRLKMEIYTNDKDFGHYSKHLPISLHQEN